MPKKTVLITLYEISVPWYANNVPLLHMSNVLHSTLVPLIDILFFLCFFFEDSNIFHNEFNVRIFQKDFLLEAFSLQSKKSKVIYLLHKVHLNNFFVINLLY